MSRELISTHFSEKHTTDEQNLPTRFDCKVCGLAGVGLRHGCSICNLVLHRSCQKRGGRPTSCSLHPGSKHRQHEASVKFKETVSGFQAIRGFFTDQASRCIFCGDKISAKTFCYACDIDPACIVHPTCFLVMKNTALPSRGTRLDAQGHVLKADRNGGSYTCATCGDRGFGLSLRCEICDRSRHHHPFCVESSRLRRNRICFRHNGTDRGMAWMPPPSYWNRPSCGVCQRKIVSHHYLCLGTAEEDSGAVHPMCAERLRQDRDYDQIRDASVRVGSYLVEGFTLGILPLATGGSGLLYETLVLIRKILPGAFGFPSI